MKAITGKGFEDHYVNQLGHGMTVFSGPRTQRGYGLGHIIRGAARSAMPLLIHAGKEALKKGAIELIEGFTSGGQRKPVVKRQRKPAKPKRIYARKGPKQSKPKIIRSLALKRDQLSD